MADGIACHRKIDRPREEARKDRDEDDRMNGLGGGGSSYADDDDDMQL